ncbi:FAD binding domain-containing protein [Rutstroemia sp. NJR-2017a BBW]|nr:FAD binding domain-containing protein [Rutstroemia sp. NJR-2017a BBW]
MSERGLTKNQVKMVSWTSIAALLGAVWFATSHSSPTNAQCRCFPGDTCWPSSAKWDLLNKTVEGRLIATIPIASPCHDTFPGISFDADKCAEIQANWPRPEFHDGTTHSPMAAFFANMSCDPFTPRDAQCITGTYVPYAVNASGVTDYRSTLAFATENNIRLVIRNTGHDYMGKSTGAGALALWTHHIKDRSILDYRSPAYMGKAMKIGAGVQASEAQATANAEGYVVVEGDCPTVGIAGGYTQGGGTSPLASKFGLAADQVLEWEVVTGTGELLTATPSQHSDLYWALAGGGGGTYGVVLSMTVKLHRNMPTAGATLSFIEPSEKYWDVVKTFLVNMPEVLKAGATLYWQILPGNMFYMPQSYFPNGTAEDLERLLQPTLRALNQSNIPYGKNTLPSTLLEALLSINTLVAAFNSVNFPEFQNAFFTLNPDMNITELNIGGSLIPRSLVASDTSATSLVSAIKSILNNGGILAGVSMDVSRPPTFQNAAHPGWRSSLFLAFLGTIYDRANMTANVLGRKTVTNVLDPALEKLTSNAAAYLNEADFNQPNWQQVFYGTNYAKLLSIKNKYDPAGIFWGPTVVGSEAWAAAADGRLCKTGY